MNPKRAVLSALLLTVLLLSLGTQAYAYRDNLLRQEWVRVVPHLDGDPDIPNPITPPDDPPPAGVAETTGKADVLFAWRSLFFPCLRALRI